jgi:antitoxin component YwqK of YwqJK toxin-antitoxin module
MIIKFSSITLFILCHVICLADVPGNQKKAGTLTVQQAAEMVKKANETQQPELDLNWLTSIDQDVARELSHYGGQRLLLDGLTSITQEVAHELTKVQPDRFGWYKKGDDTKTPQKSLSLDGLTAITQEVARELAKCNGDLDLNYVKSMDSGVARELAKFKGTFLNIQFLESIAPEDMNVLKDGLRRPGSENSYRSMMGYKLKDGTRLKKWNGKVIEYGKDGSKIREIDYKYGGVTLRMEWDEEGNLVKEDTYPVHKPRGVDEQSFETIEVTDLDEENPDFDLSFDNERFAPERKHPYDDLTFRDGVNKERIAYAKGEDEPFTGVGVSPPKRKGSLGWESRFLNGKLHGKKILFYNDGSILSEEPYLNGKLHGQSIGWSSAAPGRRNWEKQHINGNPISYKYYFRSGSVRIETSFKGGKPVLKSTWDKDGNLIEKETF